MTGALTISGTLRDPSKRYAKCCAKHPATADAGATSGRVPRVSRLMALAIYYEDLMSKGVVSRQSEIAMLCHVTRARVTQIMNLLLLAPDIQEAILFLPPTQRGHDPLHERDLRHVTAEVSWEKQRILWANLLKSPVDNR